MSWKTTLRRYIPSFGNENELGEKAIVIAVVGCSGSGLSQFIHDITGNYPEGVDAKSQIRPFTTNITPVVARIDDREVILIDNPGFDFSRGKDEYRTFERLGGWLKNYNRVRGKKYPVDGIFFIQHLEKSREFVKKSRFPISCEKQLLELCGKDWEMRAVLVNTHTAECSPNEKTQHESRMRDYWSFMQAAGSPEPKYYDSPKDQTHESMPAVGIAKQLLEIIEKSRNHK